MPQCTFCRIVEGRADTEILFEDEILVVFRDINPHAPVHLLLVPRKHIRSVNDLTEADGAIIARLVEVAGQMAREQGIDRSGYKLLFNVESGGGQVIFHLHLHLLGGWGR
jgi:histidine triad (HIT) family protein